MLVSTSVPNLINGVTQQADNLRFPSQCDEQVNLLASITEGLTKRPPTNRVAKILSGGGDAYFTYINRDPNERYLVVARGGMTPTLQAFTLDGTEVPIQDENGSPVSAADLAYLATPSPGTDLASLTISDHTFFLNRSKVVAMSPETTAVREPEALIMVKQLRQGVDFGIDVYLNPSDTEPLYRAAISNVETDTKTDEPSGPVVADQGAVAVKLWQQLQEDEIETHFHIFVDEACIYLRKKDGTDFRVEMRATMPESLFVFKDEVQNFSMLPKRAWAGFTIKVKGDPEQSGDEYYLQFVPSVSTASAFSSGHWEETRKFGLLDTIDAATMPHVLVNHGTHFVFKRVDWAPRRVGDEDTSPAPSFVGKRIRNLSFRSNRLAVLADENIVLSETSEFFNFFRTTVIQLLDSDPIDIAVGGESVAILNTAVATAEKFFLFSDNGQFSLEGSPLTPGTVDAPLLTSYENSGKISPIALGNQVYFAFNRNGYTGLCEYGLQSDTGLFAAEDITEHVPRYLRGAARFMLGSDTENTLFVATEGLPEGLYVYRFLRKNSQRLLASWSKWEFNAPLRFAFLVEDQLFLVLEREGGFVLERLDMKPGVTDEDSTFTVHLDRRIKETDTVVTYDAEQDRTTFVLPYAPTPSRFAAVKRAGYHRPVVPTPTGGGFSAGFSNGFRRLVSVFSGMSELPVFVEAGEALNIRSISGNTVVVDGNHEGTLLWFGENYDAYIDLSKPRLREQRGEGNYVVVPGRFQVRYGYLAFHSTLHFTVEVYLPGRPVSSKTFYPRYVAGITAQAGVQPTPQDGTLRFPVLSVNENVKVRVRNDGHLPCALLSTDWEALYSHRSTRV